MYERVQRGWVANWLVAVDITDRQASTQGSWGSDRGASVETCFSDAMVSLLLLG